ncbi:MAG: hypothetical protein O2913_13185 [Chloroflexi bacterium]|nr:hypothetical protein [Chloroflexota bacterium]
MSKETDIVKSEMPAQRKYNRLGGRPGLTVDFEAVCDAVVKARNGSGETITDVAVRFGVSRGWIHKWINPILDGETEPHDLE